MRWFGVFLVSMLGFLGGALTACGGDGGQEDDAGSGGTGGRVESAFGGQAFNQCGVAAPLPVDTVGCAPVTAQTLTNFDDYTGTSADSYTFHVSGEPAAADAVLGAILHVGDGSDTDGGTGVITSEMVTGEGDTGYALEVSNTNAMNWGGLLMFYFPAGPATCLDAAAYGGVQFSIRGFSPSGRFGVTLGMLDTIPVGDGGLCDNPTTSDCKDATVEWTLPSDSGTWLQVPVPWGSFTPGIGSATSCVPVTGQNIVRLVIQPFMSYPPPDYTFEPGAYAITIDNVRFF